jgi:hypothetical protein
MDTIIAYRVNGGKVAVVMDPAGEDIVVFPHHDAAVAYADANPLFQSGQADYQIVTLDEL